MSYDLGLISEVNIFSETKLRHKVLFFNVRNSLGDFYILKYGYFGEFLVIGDNEIENLKLGGS